MAEFFGFEIKRKGNKKDDFENKGKSFVPPADESGGVITVGGHYSHYLDLSAEQLTDDSAQIKKYREISSVPECDQAISDIITGAIVGDTSEPVTLNLDDLELSDKIKKIFYEEFENVLSMLGFNNWGHEIFRKWYVDGRIYYHIIIDEKNPKKGILELRPIESTQITKVKEIEEHLDPETKVKTVIGVKDYYVYHDPEQHSSAAALKISKDSIIFVPSGLLSHKKDRVIGHLDKAIKPANQLRMMEDALLIYRIARAPERRIFYIDVGNLTKGKAEEYLRGIMNNYRNKLVYDAETGEMRDERKHLSMLEDFWLPRREGGRGTEISTLPGGQNLGEIEDIIFFQKKLYKSLNVPISRLESEAQFSLGRSTEITRDEVKFQKFLDKICSKFGDVFLQALRTQLILKGIIDKDDWADIHDKLLVQFSEDTYFSELKDAEMIRERVNTLREVDEFVGKYYSVDWVRRNILLQSDEEIKEIDKDIEKEKIKYPDDEFGDDGNGNGNGGNDNGYEPPAPKPEEPEDDREDDDEEE
jgi:hypothetical protein